VPTDLPTTDFTAPAPGEPWNVVWTRGPGCCDLAEIVSGGSAVRADADLKTACITAGANVVVSAKAGGFDLAASIVGYGFDAEHPLPAVVGAIGTGPHSPLVAETTRRLAAGLGGDAVLVTMARDDEEQNEAVALLDRFADLVPGAATKCVTASRASDLVESLPPDALIVLGAPGGSWWQRQFFGPGRRLIHAAPAGAVVVRAAARRCFHDLVPLSGVGPLMRAADVAAVAEHAVIPVLDEGAVIGLARCSTARNGTPHRQAGDFMEDPVTVGAAERVQAAIEVADHFDGSPVPVVDDDGRLLGGIVV
jgi:hypothetical protein